MTEWLMVLAGVGLTIGTQQFITLDLVLEPL